MPSSLFVLSAHRISLDIVIEGNCLVIRRFVPKQDCSSKVRPFLILVVLVVLTSGSCDLPFTFLVLVSITFCSGDLLVYANVLVLQLYCIFILCVAVAACV